MPVERLHVAPPIRNEIDDHLLSDHAIDEAIGFKKNLPIFLVPQGPQADTEGSRSYWIIPIDPSFDLFPKYAWHCRKRFAWHL